MPAIDFRSLDLRDALDLAILVEEEARDRYEEFVRIVGGRYRGDASDVFRVMAANEAKHRAELVARRRALFGDAPRRLSQELLDDVEAPDRGQPRTFLSARQAVEVALASEEKAEEFFAAAARAVSDPTVRTLFEELRGEEVHHAELLRRRLSDYAPGPDVEDDEADEPGSDAG